LDITALLLLFLMVTWQMPHFYSIAIFRLKDYKAAAIPVWPAKKGVKSTKKYIIFYIVCFIVVSLLMSVFGYTSYLFAVVMSAASLYWLRVAVKGLKTTQDSLWSRKLFFLSLIVLLTMAVILPISSLLPK
jgi:protoheme IX farnesyltransferase